MPKQTSGMTVTPIPESTTDNRPWEVYELKDPDNFVIRCWYEETANDYIKIKKAQKTMAARKRKLPGRKLVRKVH